MEYRIVGLLGLLISVLCPLTSESADRQINESWDVTKGSTDRMDIQWFGGDSIDYTHRAVQGRRPVVLTNENQTVIWQVTGTGTDRTNSYLAVTGTVQQAAGVVEFFATPAQANLTAGDYAGFVRAITLSGGSQSSAVTLAYQDIRVNWSPESDTLSNVLPLPVFDASDMSFVFSGGTTHDWWFEPELESFTQAVAVQSESVTITNYEDTITYSSLLKPLVFDVGYDIVESNSVETVRFYSDTGYTDVDEVTGVATSLVTGAETIRLVSDSLERTIDVEASISPPGYYGYQEDLAAHEYLTNSVKQHVNTNFAALIEGHDGSDTNLAVFSTQDDAATNYVRNADGWAADLDLTCVSAWNSTSGMKRKMTMITPRHGLSASHYHIRQTWTGSDTSFRVRFVDATNGVHERTVTSHELVLPKDDTAQLVPSEIDVVVLRLNEPLPASIVPAKRLPVDYLETMPYTRGFTNEFNNIRRHENFPLVMPDQQNRATIGESIVYGVSGCPSYSDDGYALSLFLPKPSRYILFEIRDTYASFYRTKIDGDSSSPLLLYINDEPILTGTMTYGGGGSAGVPIVDYIDDVQSVITDDFGDTNIWQSADLSGFETFERVD